MKRAISMERKTRVLNGLLVLVAALLTIFVDNRFVWLVAMMGASLIFSGVTNFCGFAVILQRFGWADQAPTAGLGSSTETADTSLRQPTE